MRAKKVDMKKLKAAIWDILVNADFHKVRIYFCVHKKQFCLLYILKCHIIDFG